MGVDLNELGKMVDEALAGETIESLAQWLDERRRRAEVVPDVAEGVICPVCGGYLVHKTELNQHPYGDNIRYDECAKCKREYNFECF